jgi:hypothetical protein
MGGNSPNLVTLPKDGHDESESFDYFFHNWSADENLAR